MYSRPISKRYGKNKNFSDFVSGLLLITAGLVMIVGAFLV